MSSQLGRAGWTDFADRAAVEAALRELKSEWIASFAAEPHVDRSIDDPRELLNTHVIGIRDLLDASRRSLDATRFRCLQVRHRAPTNQESKPPRPPWGKGAGKGAGKGGGPNSDGG